MGANTVTLGAPTAAQCFGTEGIILDRKNTNLYIFGNARTPVLLAPSTAAGATTTTSATGGAATALPAAPRLVGRTRSVKRPAPHLSFVPPLQVGLSDPTTRNDSE